MRAEIKSEEAVAPILQNDSIPRAFRPHREIVLGKQESWLKCRVPGLPCFLRRPQRPRLSPQVPDSSAQGEDPVSLAFTCQAHRGWLPALQVENDSEVVSGLRRSKARLIMTSVVALA